MRHGFRFLLLGSTIALVACSDDEKDDDDGLYSGVIEWRCFEGPDDCWCAGLERGEDAASGNPRVDTCGYANCYTYQNYGWKCECRPAPWDPRSNYDEVAEVSACPPST
jgi:hypothetical protein